jgi:alpha-beta hydrolase superfamily lysophospholipase
MPRSAKLLIGLALIATAGVATVAVFVSEGALHIPARRRFAAHAEMADRIAQANGATWHTRQIAAADGTRLESWEFRPARWNGATVLVLHGHFDTREGTAGFAPMLLRHGYAALIPDNRGHGASGGDEVTYGVRERDDVHRWVSYALETNGAMHPSMEHAQRVYALGESMGAAILLQALPGEPRLRAVVAEGAYARFRNVAYGRVSKQLSLTPTLAAVVVEPAFFYLRTRYGIAMDQANPVEAVVHAKTPILYIHGTGDTNITPDNSQVLYDARRAGSELWQPGGATHTRASSFYPEEFERRVIGWFDGH